MKSYPGWLQPLEQVFSGRLFLGVTQLEEVLPVDLGIEDLELVYEWLQEKQIILVDENRRRPVGYFPGWVEALWEAVSEEIATPKNVLRDAPEPDCQKAHRFLLGLEEDGLEGGGYVEDDPDEPLEDPWNSYLEMARDQHRLYPEEEERFAKRALQGDKGARAALLSSFYGRVVFLARRYVKAGAQQDDLIQAGNLALVEALESYRIESPRGFSWHADRFVRRAFGRHLAEDRRSIRLPRSVDKSIRRLLDAHERICKDKAHIPSHQELAKELNLPEEEVGYLMSYLQAPLSIDAPSVPGDSLTLEETLEDEQAPSPAEWGVRVGLLERLEELLEDYSVSHRRVVALRFGLLDGVSYTRHEVERKTGLSLEEVQRLELEALAELRQFEGLQNFL